MTINHDIPVVDKQGGAETVLTQYEPHTISIVGAGALGMNITKLKSKDKFKQTEEGKAIMAKIDKAKALDTGEAVEAVVAEEVVESVEPEAVDKAKSEEEQPEVVEDTEQSPKEVSESPDADAQVEEEVAVVVSEEASEEVTKEKAKDPKKEEDEEEEEKPTEKSKEEDGDVEKTDAEDEKEKPVEKKKAYTAEDLITAKKDALDGVMALVNKLQQAVPDAHKYDISGMVYSAINQVEDAQWSAADAMFDEIYSKTYDEVNSKVEKAKSLKVSESGSFDDKVKALELIDPAMAELVRAERAKSLKAEAERAEVIRSKQLAEGSELYKRIATEGNTTDQIVDAMIKLESESPKEYSVIAKALETASNITMAGDMFRDIGKSEAIASETSDEFVERKAKSLVDTKKEQGINANLAACRATVRQSEEYAQKFS